MSDVICFVVVMVAKIRIAEIIPNDKELKILFLLFRKSKTSAKTFAIERQSITTNKNKWKTAT